jgi:hypothetical protein
LTLDTVATIGAIVGLIGTAVPSMAKSFESISLRSRRKMALQHIQDLSDLMEKIVKQDVLSKMTLDSVRAQIEAEIGSVMEQLDRNRELRLKALERRTDRVHLDLSVVRRSFLLYRPHGIRAWVAHGVAYFFALAGLLGGYGAGLSTENGVGNDISGQTNVSWTWKSFYSGGGVAWVIFCLFVVIAFRAWALRERSRWKKAQPAPPSAPNPAALVDMPL